MSWGDMSEFRSDQVRAGVRTAKVSTFFFAALVFSSRFIKSSVELIFIMSMRLGTWIAVVARKRDLRSNSVPQPLLPNLPIVEIVR